MGEAKKLLVAEAPAESSRGATRVASRGRPHPSWAVSALICAVGLAACASETVPPPPDPFERIDVGDGAYVLAGAQTSPDEQTIELGPFTLEYAGAHRFTDWEPPGVEPEEPEPEEFEADLPGGISPDAYRAIYIDETGREWRVTGHDAAAVEQLVMAADEGEGVAGEEVYPEPEYTAAKPEGAGEGNVVVEDHNDWATRDCSATMGRGTTKWFFLPGSEVDLDSVNDSQRIPIVHSARRSFSGTLLAQELVITVGHARPAIGAELCTRTAAGGSECLPIISMWRNGDAGCEEDWQLLKVERGFKTQHWYSLASGKDSFLKDFQPRLAAYPGIRLGAGCTQCALLQGERNLGEWDALKKKHLRIDITGGSGASGGAYYFWNSTKGKYMLAGVYRGRREGSFHNMYTCGPKIPYWREEIISAAAAMGVTL